MRPPSAGMPAVDERACGARVDLARAVQHREDAQHGALRAGQVRERELHLPAAQRAPGRPSAGRGSEGRGGAPDRRRGGQRTSDLSPHTGSVRRWPQLRACAQAAMRGRTEGREDDGEEDLSSAPTSCALAQESWATLMCEKKAEQSRGTLSTSPRLAWFQATNSPPNQNARAYTCMREVSRSLEKCNVTDSCQQSESKGWTAQTVLEPAAAVCKQPPAGAGAEGREAGARRARAMNSTAMLAPNASPVTSAVRQNCRQGARSSAANCAARAASIPNAATVRMAATASAAVWLARSAALLTWRRARARMTCRRRRRRSRRAPRALPSPCSRVRAMLPGARMLRRAGGHWRLRSLCACMARLRARKKCACAGTARCVAWLSSRARGRRAGRERAGVRAPAR